jgi:hypothetical protein
VLPIARADTVPLVQSGAHVPAHIALLPDSPSQVVLHRKDRIEAAIRYA